MKKNQFNGLIIILLFYFVITTLVFLYKEGDTINYTDEINYEALSSYFTVIGFGTTLISVLFAVKQFSAFLEARRNDIAPRLIGVTNFEHVDLPFKGELAIHFKNISENNLYNANFLFNYSSTHFTETLEAITSGENFKIQIPNRFFMGKTFQRLKI